MTGANVHATAMVVGTTGYLFVGPAGSGKTTAVLACLAAASRRGWNAALVADDQVLLALAGSRLVARAPVTIKGLAELRGVGPIPVRTTPAAVISFAVLPLLTPLAERVAPEAETFKAGPAVLPLLRLPLLAATDPLDVLTRFSSVR